METIKDEVKEQKRGFLPILLGTLAASMVWSALTGRGVIRSREGKIKAIETFWGCPIL